MLSFAKLHRAVTGDSRAEPSSMLLVHQGFITQIKQHRMVSVVEPRPDAAGEGIS